MIKTAEKAAQAQAVVEAARALSAAVAAFGDDFPELDDHLRSALLDAAHGAFRVTAVVSTDLSIYAKSNA